MKSIYLQLVPLLFLPGCFQNFIDTSVDVCDWDIYDCDNPYDIEVTEEFKCTPNDCPVNFKCCSHRCFRHNICQPHKDTSPEPQRISKNTMAKPGECDILLNCDIDLPDHFIKQFECLQDDDCPDHFKCCYIQCYEIKVCQPAKNEHLIVDYTTRISTTIRQQTPITQRTTSVEDYNTDDESDDDDDLVNSGDYSTKIEIPTADYRTQEVFEVFEIETTTNAMDEIDTTESILVTNIGTPIIETNTTLHFIDEVEADMTTNKVTENETDDDFIYSDEDDSIQNSDDQIEAMHQSWSSLVNVTQSHNIATDISTTSEPETVAANIEEDTTTIRTILSTQNAQTTEEATNVAKMINMDDVTTPVLTDETGTMSQNFTNQPTELDMHITENEIYDDHTLSSWEIYDDDDDEVESSEDKQLEAVNQPSLTNATEIHSTTNVYPTKKLKIEAVDVVVKITTSTNFSPITQSTVTTDDTTTFRNPPEKPNWVEVSTKAILTSEIEDNSDNKDDHSEKSKIIPVINTTDSPSANSQNIDTVTTVTSPSNIDAITPLTESNREDVGIISTGPFITEHDITEEIYDDEETYDEEEVSGEEDMYDEDGIYGEEEVYSEPEDTFTTSPLFVTDPVIIKSNDIKSDENKIELVENNMEVQGYKKLNVYKEAKNL